MLEELAPTVIKALFRGLWYIIREIIIEVVFFYTGWYTIKCLSLGKYPAGKPDTDLTRHWFRDIAIGLTGSMVWVIVFYFLYLLAINS